MFLTSLQLFQTLSLYYLNLIRCKIVSVCHWVLHTHTHTYTLIRKFEENNINLFYTNPSTCFSMKFLISIPLCSPCYFLNQNFVYHNLARKVPNSFSLHLQLFISEFMAIEKSRGTIKTKCQLSDEEVAIKLIPTSSQKEKVCLPLLICVLYYKGHIVKGKFLEVNEYFLNCFQTTCSTIIPSNLC